MPRTSSSAKQKRIVREPDYEPSSKAESSTDLPPLTFETVDLQQSEKKQAHSPFSDKIKQLLDKGDSDAKTAPVATVPQPVTAARAITPVKNDNNCRIA